MLNSKTFKEEVYRLSNCRVFFDFDNTITMADVLDDMIKRFSINDLWIAQQEAWQNEEISAKECLLSQMSAVRITQKDLNVYLSKVALDPHFVKLLDWLRQQGVEPVIVSDNFKTIIEQILSHHNIQGLAVYANHLGFINDRLFPSFPHQNPSCSFCAHCKKLQFNLNDSSETRKIIYVGDGRSDICAALESDVVYAKDTLLSYFKKHKRPCVEFSSLADVHKHLKEEFDGIVVTA